MIGRNHDKGKVSPLREVYVARTVQAQQWRFDHFLDGLGRNLLGLANVYVPSSTHVTFLENILTEQFRQRKYSSRDVRSFSALIKTSLDAVLAPDPITVRIDAEKPLVLRGQSKGSLALNVLPDERLTNERLHIESFLSQHFETLPNMRPFDPHITFARFLPTVSNEDRYEVLTEITGQGVPGMVALNGLNVYLRSIEDGNEV